MPMFQQNEYSDLPNPQRAQEIINEARQRLAAQGGKANMLPAMIERVTNEFAQRDVQRRMSNPHQYNDYAQPNNMDAYIDRVLEMSGMTEKPAQAQQQNTGTVNTPHPTPRPAAGDVSVGPANIEAVDGQETDDDGGLGYGTLAGILGGTVVAGTAGKYLYDRYKNKQSAANSINGTDDPKATVMAVAQAQGREAAIQYARENGIPLLGSDLQEMLQLTDETDDMPAISDQSEGMKAIDSEINKTMDDTGRQIAPRDAAEEASKGMTQSSPYDASIRAVADANDPEEAIANLKRGGLQFTPEQENMFRNEFSLLKQRAAEIIGNNVRRAVRP